MLTKRRGDRDDDAVELCQHIGVRDSDDVDATALKLSITMGIIGGVLAGAVVLSIHFDSELCLVTEEVHDVRPHRVLASEFESEDIASPQGAPQRCLSSGRVLSLVTGSLSDIIKRVMRPRTALSGSCRFDVACHA